MGARVVGASSTACSTRRPGRPSWNSSRSRGSGYCASKKERGRIPAASSLYARCDTSFGWRFLRVFFPFGSSLDRLFSATAKKATTSAAILIAVGMCSIRLLSVEQLFAKLKAVLRKIAAYNLRAPPTPSSAFAGPSPLVLTKSLVLNVPHTSPIQDTVNLNGKLSSEANMGYGRDKTEGGHKRGHSNMAYWGTHQEKKAGARKQRRNETRRLARKVLIEATPAQSHRHSHRDPSRKGRS